MVHSSNCVDRQTDSAASDHPSDDVDDGRGMYSNAPLGGRVHSTQEDATWPCLDARGQHGVVPARCSSNTRSKRPVDPAAQNQPFLTVTCVTMQSHSSRRSKGPLPRRHRIEQFRTRSDCESANCQLLPVSLVEFSSFAAMGTYATLSATIPWISRILRQCTGRRL